MDNFAFRGKNKLLGEYFGIDKELCKKLEYGRMNKDGAQQKFMIGSFRVWVDSYE